MLLSRHAGAPYFAGDFTLYLAGAPYFAGDLATKNFVLK
jgi:hypothetical protein